MANPMATVTVLRRQHPRHNVAAGDVLQTNLPTVCRRGLLYLRLRIRKSPTRGCYYKPLWTDLVSCFQAQATSLEPTSSRGVTRRTTFTGLS